MNGVSNGHTVVSDSEATESEDEGANTLGFAIFALRDLKAREEVVLGWEWDDGSVVHKLPALVEMGDGKRGEGPSKLTCVSFFLNLTHVSHSVVHHANISNRKPSPHHVERLRLQMQNIVHSIQSSFIKITCLLYSDLCKSGLNSTKCRLKFPSGYLLYIQASLP